MGQRTALYDNHLAAGAKMVDFAGWDMPIHYGSQVQEHHQVRQGAGMFDVSHMTVVDLSGADAKPFLMELLANNVDRLRSPGKALYTCMLNGTGGVIDDLIVYYLSDTDYRLVVNSATRQKDLDWINSRAAGWTVQIDERDGLSMIAVQGPQARDLATPLLPEALREPAAALKPFFSCADGDWFVAATGYTGEDGYEIILPHAEAPAFWEALRDNGVAPTGLGARDTLRLEAGMNLYGADMTEETSPLESGLDWTVAWEPGERQFVGREALERQRVAGVARKLVGLVLDGKGVLRNHQQVSVFGNVVGEITSGSFSPTLGRAIALARVAADVEAEVSIDMRGRAVSARVVAPPFVRRGKILVSLD